MSWKFVFNTHNKLWGNLEDAIRVASDSGYKFVFFNGEVYFLQDYKMVKTGIKTNDLS